MAVYILKNEISGLVKIGYSANPTKRLPCIQTGSHDPLRIVRMLDGGRREEAELHRRFAGDRRRGEWFSLPDAAMLGDMGLTDLPITEQPSGKPGRPMIGERPLTPAERQARRLARYKRIQTALEDILAAQSLDEAQALARGALYENENIK